MFLWMRERTKATKRLLVTAAAVAVLGTVAVIASPWNVVKLPGGQWISGTTTYTLKNVVWNRSTNQVSAVLVFEQTEGISNVVAPDLQLGTYDHTQLPLTAERITRHTVQVTPVLDASGKRLVWTISDFQIPRDEKFAGVYVTNGSYQRGVGPNAKTRSIRVTLAMAHNRW